MCEENMVVLCDCVECTHNLGKYGGVCEGSYSCGLSKIHIGVDGCCSMKTIKEHTHEWTEDPMNNQKICFKCGIKKPN